MYRSSRVPGPAHSAVNGAEFTRRYLSGRSSLPQLTTPESLADNEALAQSLTDLLCNWNLDPQYARIITAYLRHHLPEDASVRVVKYLKKLRRDGFLISEEDATHVAERKAIIALAFALDDQLPRYSPNPRSPSAAEDTANALLQLAGYDRLYARSPEDASVIFALNNRLDMHVWQTELQPVCRPKMKEVPDDDLMTLDDLRAHIRSCETPEGVTADVTGMAHESLSELRCGDGEVPAQVFADWMEAQNGSVLSIARERARLYLCRALLTTLESQIHTFLAHRDKELAKDIYVREAMADHAQSLWLKGRISSTSSTGQFSPKALHFSAVLQDRRRTEALTDHDFGDLNLNFTRIATSLTDFYQQESGLLGMPVSALTPNCFKQMLNGQFPLSRALLIRLLVFLDAKNEAFVNNRLVRAGFAPLDPAHSVDDALMGTLLEQPEHRSRDKFLTEVSISLHEYDCTYSCMKLTNGIWTQNFL